MKSSVAAALAASALAQAFLLPPEVSKADVAAAEAVAEQFSPVSTLVLKGTERKTLMLDCPGCPVPVIGEHGTVEGLAVKPNHLKLMLHVNHEDGKPDTLMLNNMEVYPTLDPARATLIAAQFVDEEATEEPKEEEHKDEEGQPDEAEREEEKKDDENEDLRRDVHPAKAINRRPRVGGKPSRGADDGYPQRLGFGLSVEPPIVGADDSQLELIKMHLQIIEVGQAFIDGIPGVHIEVVRVPESGRLMLAKVEPTRSQSVAPATPLHGQPQDDGGKPSTNPADFDRCSSALCRWLVALRAKMQAIAKAPLAVVKGHRCGHHKAAAPAVDAAAVSPEEAAAMPGAYRAFHGAHGHGRHGHHFRHMFKNVVAHILLPIMVGIVAGISVSLVGVVIGTLAVSLWRLARGRSPCQRGLCRLAAARRMATVIEEADDEEKAGLMEYKDLPPQYEAEPQTPTKQDTRKEDA